MSAKKAYITDFAIAEKYDYLSGFGAYHSSEAFPGATPAVNNSPQKPPYGLRTERISGTAFTTARAKNLQTWMYRASASLVHSGFESYGEELESPSQMSPNSYFWPSLPINEECDWTQPKLMARNGDPASKSGTAIWVFAITKSMAPMTAFSSLDGDALIILQSGSLDIQTELGKLVVRQNEIAVIPRGIRYRVDLLTPSARGFICELYQGHWDLPELGPIGSTGLANVRDFQIPTAHFDGHLDASTSTAISSHPPSATFTIISRLNTRLWRTTQTHTPFDVAAWHGTYYPFKYDLSKFCVLSNALFDEHDPSLYVILSASQGSAPGASAVEFLLIPPRWQVADALWLPYYHRNTHSEWYAPIVRDSTPSFAPNATGTTFSPFGAGLNGTMTTHGPAEEDFQRFSNMRLEPTMLQNEGVAVALLETEKPLFLSRWADGAAVKNLGGKPKPKI